MRRLFAMLFALLLVPAWAAAQRVSPSDTGTATATLAPGRAATDGAWLVPIWLSPEGQWMATLDQDQWRRAPLKRVAVDRVADSHHVITLGRSRTSSVGITMGTSTHLYTGLRLNRIGHAVPTASACGGDALFNPECSQVRQTWLGGTLVGGYRGDGLLIDLGVDWLRHDRGGETGLYLVVPDTERSRLMGIPADWIDSFSRIEASGRVDLGDSGAHLNMGASIGQMELLPVHSRLSYPGESRLLSDMRLPGMDRINQKSISLGVGTDTISTTLVGRLMQPETSNPLGVVREQWSAVDLGITVHLPWEGELKLGAQNLWSSAADDGAVRHEPDLVHSRIPYIQYHQNL